jgi:hypothetical protein
VPMTMTPAEEGRHMRLATVRPIPSADAFSIQHSAFSLQRSGSRARKDNTDGSWHSSGGMCSRWPTDHLPSAVRK